MREYKEVEERPWGKYFVLEDEPDYKLKRIEVNPGQRLSYQYHNHRSEAWTIVKGEALIILNEKPQSYGSGETILIPQGTRHRVQNMCSETLVFIEVQTGTYFGEDDIVRLEDDYQRI